MTYTISSTDLSHIDFDRSETVKCVLQNVAVILATPLGSVPLQRDFGLDMSFLDKPDHLAATYGAARVREAIRRWEPRAEFVDMSVTRNAADPSSLTFQVEVEINDGE